MPEFLDGYFSSSFHRKYISIASRILGGVMKLISVVAVNFLNAKKKMTEIRRR